MHVPLPVRRRNLGDGRLQSLVPYPFISHLTQQPCKVKADFVENEVGTLRIAHEQAELVLAAVNQKAMSAEGEIEPRFRGSLAHVVDHFGAAQQQNMIADNLPRGNPRESGKVPRSIERSFVDQFHGACQCIGGG